MPKLDDFIEMCRVTPGKKAHLGKRDPAWAGDKRRPKKERKEFAEKLLSDDLTTLAASQELLFAANTWSVLVVLQAMDTAGKDGTIKHVMSGVNPVGCQVYSFKQPSREELEHNFLWRYSRCLPERGRIGIFNRSYYEEVLVTRVHPELLQAERLPSGKLNAAFWAQRFDDINAFERHLTTNGTLVLKFFLHISKEEQRQRLLARLKEPDKHWKFSPADLRERSFWDEYQDAYEHAIRATSTPWAPWYVIPADHKWVARALVAGILTQGIASLNLAYPKVSADLKTEIAKARKKLER